MGKFKTGAVVEEVMENLAGEEVTKEVDKFEKMVAYATGLSDDNSFAETDEAGADVDEEQEDIAQRVKRRRKKRKEKHGKEIVTWWDGLFFVVGLLLCSVCVACIAMCISLLVVRNNFVSSIEDTFELAGSNEKQYYNADIDYTTATAQEIEQYAFESEDIMADIQAEYGEDFDVSKLIRLGDYYKARYAEQEGLYVDANGNAYSPMYLLQTAYDSYVADLTAVYCMINAKDAINDLYSRVCPDVYEVANKSFKTESVLELRGAVSRIVVDDALKSELSGLSDKIYRIIEKTYDGFVQEIQTENKTALSFPGGITDFSSLEDYELTAMRLACCENYSYTAYKAYLTADEDVIAAQSEAQSNMTDSMEKLESFFNVLPFVSAEKVDELAQESTVKFMKKHMLPATEAENKMLAKAFDSEFWGWNWLYQLMTVESGSILLGVDYNTLSEYYILVDEAVCDTLTADDELALCWAVAEEAFLVYAQYGAGENESTYLTTTLGVVDEELKEAYGYLNSALGVQAQAKLQALLQ